MGELEDFMKKIDESMELLSKIQTKLESLKEKGIIEIAEGKEKHIEGEEKEEYVNRFNNEKTDFEEMNANALQNMYDQINDKKMKLVEEFKDQFNELVHKQEELENRKKQIQLETSKQREERIAEKKEKFESILKRSKVYDTPEVYEKKKSNVEKELEFIKDEETEIARFDERINDLENKKKSLQLQYLEDSQTLTSFESKVNEYGKELGISLRVKDLSSTEKPTEKPIEKPTGKPTGKPTEKPIEKPTEKPTGKPIEKPTGKPIEDKTDEKLINICLDAETGEIVLTRKLDNEVLYHSRKSLKDLFENSKTIKKDFIKDLKRNGIKGYSKKTLRNLNPAIIGLLSDGESNEEELLFEYMNALEDGDITKLPFDYDIKLDNAVALDNKTFIKLNRQALKDNKNLGTQFSAIKNLEIKSLLAKIPKIKKLDSIINSTKMLPEAQKERMKIEKREAAKKKREDFVSKLSPEEIGGHTSEEMRKAMRNQDKLSRKLSKRNEAKLRAQKENNGFEK